MDLIIILLILLTIVFINIISLSIVETAFADEEESKLYRPINNEDSQLVEFVVDIDRNEFLGRVIFGEEMGQIKICNKKDYKKLDKKK